jgi:DNA repair exonuclease SbcCD ATPase subunit
MHPWIFVITNISVAVGTLILAYMAYKSINESRRAKEIEIRTSDLKNLAKSWKAQLPHILAQYNPVLSPPKPEKHPIEEHPLFSDIQNYTPPKWDIHRTWEEFKKQLHEYAEKRYELFKSILDEALKRTKLNYNLGSKEKEGIFEGFPVTIYEQLVSWAKEGKRYYDVKERLSNGGSEGKYEARFGGTVIFKVSELDRYNDIKKIYEDMMNNLDPLLDQFREKIEKISKINENLEKYHKDLTIMLDNFIFIPVLQRTCKFMNTSKLINDKSKIYLYKLSTIFYLCAIATFVIWIYIQFFSSEIAAFSIALLGIRVPRKYGGIE